MNIAPDTSGNGPAPSDNFVEGNFIGVDVAGNTALGIPTLTNPAGVAIGSPTTGGANHNVIGGVTLGAGNVISGIIASSGTSFGVLIQGAGTSSNLVEGNYIGLNADGTTAVSNNAGVKIFDSASDNTIGGTSASAGNVISGNNAGISFLRAGGGNVVEGNFIGTNARGTGLPENDTTTAFGISMSSSTSGNIIGGITSNAPGGLTPGVGSVFGEPTPYAGNLISGNQVGMWVESSNNTVEGNYVGTEVDGTDPLANGSGIELVNAASHNTVGGIAKGAGNLVSGNTSVGLSISDDGTQDNVVEGNTFGTDKTGTQALGDGHYDIEISGNQTSGFAAFNTIGGSVAAAANVISGNSGGIGIFITGSVVGVGSTSANVVEGNYIGTNAAGSKSIGDKIGVEIQGTSGNTIGGTGNIIGGNVIGVELDNASNNTVQGNYIGLNAAGVAIPNSGDGIFIWHGSSGNIIGGDSAGDSNVIAFNGGSGIEVQDTSSGNAILGNDIFSNSIASLRNTDNRAKVRSFSTSPLPITLLAIDTSPTSTTIVGSFSDPSEADSTFDLNFFANPDGSDDFEGDTSWAPQLSRPMPAALPTSTRAGPRTT